MPTQIHRVLFVSLLAAIPFAGAANLPERADHQPRVLGFEFEKRQAHGAKLRRRDGTAVASLSNLETLYFINVSIGTPEQEFQLQLDTGSSDLWVNAEGSSFCTEDDDPCSVSGTYDSNSSSTYEYVNSAFNISYADGSGAAGDYVKDTIGVAGVKVDGFEFGIGYDSTSAQSVLGIGYTINEALVVDANQEPYKNLPARMASDGVVASSAYSLWLDSLQSNTGSILFGGLDRAKFEGQLASVPIVKYDGLYQQVYVTMTGLVFSTESYGDLDVPVLLDSGSTLSQLPTDILGPIYDAAGAVYDSSEEVALINCSVRDNKDISMVFNFTGSATVSVALSELVLDLQDYTDSSQSGDGDCVFGISPSSSNVNVLGDTFLRSAYAVYDLDNNNIWLAQSNFNAGDSDIVEFGSGSNAVSSATGTSATSTNSSGDDDEGAGAALAPPSLGPMVAAAVGVLIGFTGMLL